MRRVLLKHDSSIGKYLKLLDKFCIREVNSAEGIVLILTDDGFTICSKMLPDHILKSVKVDLYNVLVISSSGRDCRSILKTLPYCESFIYGRKSESLIDENYSINFKGFFSESEISKLKSSNSISLFKVKNVVKLNCRTPIKNIFSLEERIYNDLKSSVYDIFGFESIGNLNSFVLCVDLNKIDFINFELDYLNITDIKVFNDYNLN